jgi:CheY-like chemotaxis protein
MPVMDGITMAKQLRDQQRLGILNPNLRLILLTGGNKKDVSEED